MVTHGSQGSFVSSVVEDETSVRLLNQGRIYRSGIGALFELGMERASGSECAEPLLACGPMACALRVEGGRIKKATRLRMASILSLQWCVRFSCAD